MPFGDPLLHPPAVSKSIDRQPHLPGAGSNGGAAGNIDTTEQILKPDVYMPEKPTPAHVQRWRKDYEPGKVCIHPGISEDTDHTRIARYGKVEPVGAKVCDIMNVAPKSELLERAQKKKEAIYLSSKREPLGAPFVRGHALPAELVQRGFGAACPQDISGEQSKELLHPPERIVPEEEKALYVKSHANYDPGEQRRRNYDWKDDKGPIDPKHYAFGGIVVERDVGGMAKAMNPMLDEKYKKPEIVVEKLLEDWREVSAEGLGRAKNLGHGNLVDPEHAFGMPSQKGPEWGTRECMGNYTRDEQQPDVDLGKSTKPGWRNIAPQGRIFGVPSIRHDIVAPAQRSVSDYQNYGDEAGAGQILSPPRFTDGGVGQADFLQARDAAELRDIFAAIGVELSDADFAATYETATKMDPSGLVSVESFRRALNAATMPEGQQTVSRYPFAS